MDIVRDLLRVRLDFSRMNLANVHLVHLTVHLVNPKRFAENVLKVFNYQPYTSREFLYHIVKKFVEMEKDLNLNAMMTIEKIKMDAVLTAKLKMGGLVQVDLPFRQAHAFIMSLQDRSSRQPELFICSEELSKALDSHMFLQISLRMTALSVISFCG